MNEWETDETFGIFGLEIFGTGNIRHKKYSAQGKKRRDEVEKTGRRGVNRVKEKNFSTDTEQPGTNKTSPPVETFDRLWESFRSHDPFFRTVMQNFDRARRFLSWALLDNMLSVVKTFTTPFLPTEPAPAMAENFYKKD